MQSPSIIYQLLKEAILDSLFPIQCAYCFSEGSFLCKKCLNSLPKLSTQLCLNCKKPSLLGITHPECFKKYPAQGIFSLYNYSVIKNAISLGKFKLAKPIFEILGTELASAIGSLKLEDYTVTWIPVQDKKMNLRGFNHAEVIAIQIATNCQLKALPLLQKSKSSFDQKTLNDTQRKNNVSNIFKINTRYPIPKQILLIDDVTSTGSTLLEATKTLREAGAEHVYCVTIARG